MNEGKAREDMARAEKAEAVLRNEIFIESFDYLEKEFTQAWKKSAVGDSEARERLYMLCQNLEALKGYIYKVVEDGKMAKAALQELQSRQQFEKRK